MLWKFVWAMKSSITSIGKEKLIASNDEVVWDEWKKIKDDVKSLINFSSYKEDIESFMTIDFNSNKYNKKTKRLDLTKLVFWTLKGMFKEHFIDYISHPDFKNLILKVYWLKWTKWEYKISFDAEEGSESFIVINISDNRRYSWFSWEEVDLFILNKLWIRDNSEMSHFLNKIIYWIDESFEWYTWKFFKQFIYSHIIEEVNKLLEERNDITKIFLNWASWVIDKSLYLKAMAWKIYRDNFDYIHKMAWHKLMSDIPKVILDELLSNNSENLREIINWEILEVIIFLNNFDSSKDNILDIEDKLNNDVLLNFQDRIKLYFQKFDKTEIDSELLKWTISFLIENNNLSLDIEELSDSIFRLLDDNIEELELLFSKYSWNIVEENWKQYRYCTFKIRDLKEISGKKYSVKKILESIKLIIDEIKEFESKIELEELELENTKLRNYNYKTNIWDKQKKILEYDKKIEEVVKRREEIKIKLDKQDEAWMIDRVLWKNKINGLLKVEYDELYQNLLTLTRARNNLEVLILWSNTKVSELNNSNTIKNRKIKDLKLIYNNKVRSFNRIRDDFMRNILFGREEVK